MSIALSRAALLGLLVAAGCAAPPRASDPVADDVRAAIAGAWRAHVDAAQRKDVAGVMELYATDVLYVVPGEVEERGHAAVERMEAAALAGADVLAARHATEALSVQGDLAYELGTVVGPVQPHGQPPVTVTFHYMALWRRGGDGVWRIAVLVGRA